MSDDEDDASSPRAGSMRAQIAALAVGETYSRSERLDFDTCTRAGLQESTKSIRKSVDAGIHRAKKETRGTYTLEVGEWRTHSLDIVVTILVTRVA